MRDASLDEFLNQDDENDETSEEGADADADTGACADADPGVEPAMSTYDWSPGGTPCEACGAVVERRWRDGERLVCGECKEW